MQQVNVERGGYHLYAEATGEGPPLLMVHGLSRDNQSWHIGGFIEYFSQRYQCICVDVLGHGSSDDCIDLARFHPYELAKDIVAILDSLGIEKTHYLGYSMGAGIGIALSSVAPERIASLITGGFSPDAANDVNPKVIDAVLEGYEIAIEKGQKAYLDFLEQAGALDEVARRAVLTTDKRYFKNYRAALLGFLRQQLDILPNYNRLEAPKMLYVGSEDEYFPGLLSGEWRRFKIDTRYIIEGAHHSMGDAHRHNIVKEIAAFLDELSR